jgi:uncharacterized protein
VKVDLSRAEAEPVPFEGQLELSEAALDPSQLEGPVAVRLQGVVRRVGESLRAEGRVAMRGAVRCARCLERAEWQTEEDFAVDLVERRLELAPAEGEEDRDDTLDVVYVDDDLLDLPELAAQQVLLALPMRVLCRDDCAGLCPRCGGNRNRPGDCRCLPEIDPRWHALRDVTVQHDPAGEPENE